MMYSEFVSGTGCKQTEYNYGVYKRLEMLYMIDDTMSKEDVYEWGKKLVDNSKTAAEIEAENKLKDEIKSINDDILTYYNVANSLKETKEYWKERLEKDKTGYDKEAIEKDKIRISEFREREKKTKERIKMLKNEAKLLKSMIKR